MALPVPILYSSRGGLSALNFCNFLSAQIPELGRLYYASAHSFLTGVANVENLRREFPRERRFHPPLSFPPPIPFSIFNRKTRLPLGISANNGAMERGLNYSAWPTALTTGSQTILVNHQPTVGLTFRAQRNLAAWTTTVLEERLLDNRNGFDYYYSRLDVWTHTDVFTLPFAKSRGENDRLIFTLIFNFVQIFILYHHQK